MFEVYDMVYANRNCTELNLKGRVGLVFGVNIVKGLVHIAFDHLDYAVTVPENWLYKLGVLCQRDRDAEMQCYLPRRFIRRGNASEADEIRFIEFTEFTRTWNCELDGSFSGHIIYCMAVYTKSGQIYDSCNLNNVDAIGYCPVKDYSKVVSNPTEHIRPTDIIPEDAMKYCRNDISITRQAVKNILNTVYGKYGTHSKTLKEEIQMKTQSQSACNPIKKVIFNDPATIVFWNDGTKTVVQSRGEAFDPEKGLAMAICRHYLCDICHLEEYHGLFEKHLKNYRKAKTGYGNDAATSIIDDYDYDPLSRLINGNAQEIIK